MRRKRSKPSFTNILEALSQDSALPPKDLRNIARVFTDFNFFIQQRLQQVPSVQLLDGSKLPILFSIQLAAHNGSNRS